jgi:nicotinate-nucleotide adenylyltransferase
MKIAIYAGSFNPIHNGHLAIAKEVLHQGAAEQIWFLVSPQNPLKVNSQLLPEQDRLEMVRLAIEGEPNLIASDYEFYLPRPSYTILTLDGLKKDFPEHHFVLLIGGDNLSIFHKWVEHQRIISDFGLIIYPRPGYESADLLKFENTTYLAAKLLDISATELREKARKGESIDSLTPTKVADYLRHLL